MATVPGEEHHVPEPLQPVLSLLTQGLNVHAQRLDALARAIMRLERGALQQAEAAELSRAEAERRAAEDRAKAEASEADFAWKLQAVEAAHSASHAALEQRMAELEARLEAVPPSLDELSGRYAQHEQARSAHERELNARAAEIAEMRESQAALATRVQSCAQASALASAEASAHAAQAALREDLAEGAAKQRRLALQTNALQEGHSQLHSLLSEQQAVVGALQKTAADAATDAETTRGAVRDLNAAHRQLEADQAQLNDTMQDSLARAVASAESTKSDSQRVTSTLSELEGWSRRLERLESDLTAAERKVDGAADEMRRQATHLEGSQRNSMLQASQQVALHVKALSGDLLRELQGKATIVDTQQLFDAMHKQFLSLREAHRSLVAHVEAQGAAAETVADEAATAALQAQGALRGSEKLREETHEWLRLQLHERPTRSVVEQTAATAAESAVRFALAQQGGGMSLMAPPQPMVAATALSAAQQGVSTGQPAATTPAPNGTAPGAMSPASVPIPGTSLGAMLSHVRELFAQPLEVRIEALELSRRRIEVALDELSSQRWSQRELKAIEAMRERLHDQLRDELMRRMPSTEQVETLKHTLSSHIQRLPIVASFPHGRWTWTRGKLRSAGGRQPPLLPWTSEKLNTSPDTFGWSSERSYIEVLAPGMYVVSAAVFVAGNATIGVTVNGQTVLRKAASSRQVVDASGLVAGSSLRDVLSLLAGTRVAVQCEVNSGAGGTPLHDAHGLLEIKKLW